ncbi:alkane 1-monooxygenase [Spongiivirga citrea]|uniref:Alkane 1-monooxygenase n=1 Tax=Spongiivirga citrea TaxID=1481457 RepID=A0A6M0CMX9_9FLAO|nr:alkane 1-monooxygenase [Spongiivirga citrea]NER17404.1 alkane 1-monooxygenase [Spongiivirga citrea]
MKDLKYLAAFSIPLVAFVGISQQGIWSFLTPVYVFGMIPIMETLLPVDTDNLDDEERENKKKSKLFDWLLYLNVPIVFGLIVFTLIQLITNQLQLWEIAGLVFSLGIVLGSNGINVAHELGHRTLKHQQFLGKLLLMPSHYMHFYIEHNFGHHLLAATEEDPATARYNQSLYSFWVTSVFRQYFSAWSIQRKLLKNNNLSFFSIKNDMAWYVLFQLTYLTVIFFAFGLPGLILAIAAGIVGLLLLETINYIEHYGLRRAKKESGRYERVREIHSWNSNHVVGRVVLYELTRHSDHHYKSSKKYQILDHHDQSPQMPFGYPTSMVLSTIPPLWFYIMNKRVPEEMKVLAA